MNEIKELTVVEREGKRVLTTQQLAEVYETETNNISKNFANNKERFIEGRDYYFLQGEELKEFKGLLNDIPEPLKFTPQLYLWTERGANRHCKILDTDMAWQQFDILEDTYFKVKDQKTQLPSTYKEALINLIAEIEEKEKLQKQLTEVEPALKAWDRLINSQQLFDMELVAKAICERIGKQKVIGRNQLYDILREEDILQTDTYINRKGKKCAGEKHNVAYQKYIDPGYFVTKFIPYEIGSKKLEKATTYITGKGLEYIWNKLIEKEYIKN